MLFENSRIFFMNYGITIINYHRKSNYLLRFSFNKKSPLLFPGMLRKISLQSRKEDFAKKNASTVCNKPMIVVLCFLLQEIKRLRSSYPCWRFLDFKYHCNSSIIVHAVFDFDLHAIKRLRLSRNYMDIRDVSKVCKMRMKNSL